MILEFAINLLTSVSRSGILIKQMEYFSELNVGVISLCMYRAKMSNILQFQMVFFVCFFPYNNIWNYLQYYWGQNMLSVILISYIIHKNCALLSYAISSYSC